MDSIILVGIILVAVSAVLIVLRTPMPAVFLSLISGKLIAEQLGPQALEKVNGVIQYNDANIVNLVLLLLPVVLTILLMQGKVSHSKLLFNSIGMILVGASVVVFIDPYTGIISKLNNTDFMLISQYQGYVVSLTAVFAVVLTWFSLGFSRHKKKKH